MKPAVGAFAVAGTGITQIALAAALSAVVGQQLTGEFPLDDSGEHTSSCALSMRGAGVCTAAYVSTVVSCLMSVTLIAMQCATSDGRFGLGFCGPMLSLLGFFWWLVYGATATSAALGASDFDDGSFSVYRTAVVALSWSLMILFMTSFFLSAAAASAAARARAKLDASLSGAEQLGAIPAHGGRVDPALAIKLKRFNQPLASPPVSPSKSSIRSFGSSAYDVFSESESPKKWAQPYSKRSHAVTSDGLRTLLLVGGEPVPLSAATSPSLSPVHSPTARSPLARSPLARALQSATGQTGSGASVGSFRHVLLPRVLPGPPGGAEQPAAQQ